MIAHGKGNKMSNLIRALTQCHKLLWFWTTLWFMKCSLSSCCERKCTWLKCKKICLFFFLSPRFYISLCRDENETFNIALNCVNLMRMILKWWKSVAIIYVQHTKWFICSKVSLKKEEENTRDDANRVSNIQQRNL